MNDLIGLGYKPPFRVKNGDIVDGGGQYVCNSPYLELGTSIAEALNKAYPAYEPKPEVTADNSRMDGFVKAALIGCLTRKDYTTTEAVNAAIYLAGFTIAELDKGAKDASAST